MHLANHAENSANGPFRQQSVAMACPPAQPLFPQVRFVGFDVLYKAIFVSLVTAHQETSLMGI